MSTPAPLPGEDLVVEGRRLHLVRRGDGPAVLLLHGLGTDSTLWREVMLDLGQHCHVLAVDLLGTGRSERPTVGGGRAGGRALLLAGLLDRLELTGVTVAGHGIGGAVAVHLALVAPARVGAVALLAAPLHPRIWPARVAAPPAADLAATEQAWRRLTAVAPPTLVLWGERDEVLPADYGRGLAADMPGAAWVPVAGAGHRLPTECPERVAEELAGFAAEPG